jgi:small subunit ribosomal protein S6e
MKIIISDPKTGKSYGAELAKERESLVLGRKIGDKLDGSLLGAAGYTFVLTGGSDKSGFPMRKDISGSRSARILLSGGVGFHAKRNGERRRMLVKGNTYSQDIVQVNSVVEQSGAAPLEQVFPPAAKKEEKK